jgi:glucose-fructose oxidoreductase
VSMIKVSDGIAGVSRREFLYGVGGGTLIASQFAEAAQPSAPLAQGQPEPKLQRVGEPPIEPSRRVGWAVVGLGKLALDQVLPAFGACGKSRLVALVSGDRAKAQRVASQYGVDPKHIYDYDSYDAIAQDPAIQVVYIILPNSLHANFSLRASRAGKHVLCEKPMAISATECQQMIDAAAQAQRKLMIGYRCHYEPCNLAAINLLRQGEIGKIRAVVTDNGQAIDPTDPAGEWRLRKSLAGGGSLMDIGIYGLNAARYLTGEEPIEVAAMVNSPGDDPRFREVEDLVVFTLRFPSGAIAHCSTSYSYAATSRFAVQGTTGVLTLDPATTYYEHALHVKTEKGSRKVELHEINQFAAEMDHFSAAILNQQPVKSPGEEGMQDVRLMHSIYEAARLGRPIKIDWTYRRPMQA